MSALTGRVRGSGRSPAGDWPIDSGQGDRLPMGLLLADGTTMQLGGQPSVASSPHGWGNMSFTTFRFLTNRYGTQPGLT